LNFVAKVDAQITFSNDLYMFLLGNLYYLLIL